MYSFIDNVQKRLYNEDRFYAEIQKESEVFVMDSPSRKSQNKVLVLIVGLLIVAVIAAYGVISSGVLEEKIDAEMEITAQIESDNLAYVTVETNLPDETNIIISLVGAGNSNDTGYNTNYKADDSLQIVDGRAVAGPFSNNGVALPFGNYKVEVTVPLAETQPQDVQKVFGKNMIVTTNIPLSVMKQAVDLDDRRIYDRILEVCVPIMFDGDSFRKSTAADNLKTAARLLG